MFIEELTSKHECYCGTFGAKSIYPIIAKNNSVCLTLAQPSSRFFGIKMIRHYRTVLYLSIAIRYLLAIDRSQQYQ